jgi:hypothetical protein
VAVSRNVTLTLGVCQLHILMRVVSMKGPTVKRLARHLCYSYVELYLHR